MKTIFSPINKLQSYEKSVELIQESMDLAKDALEKIREERASKKYIKENYEKTTKTISRLNEFHEPYEKSLFENKMKVDLLYFNQLLQKLEEGKDETERLILNLFKDVEQLYEFINVAPEIYSVEKKVDILNESVEFQNKYLSENIYEFFNNSLYKLSPEKREEKYFTECKDMVKDLVKKGIETDAAIQFSIKKVITENLLNKILFPSTVSYKIKDLMEDEDYGRVFDQPKLIEINESVQDKIKILSSVIAAVI